MNGRKIKSLLILLILLIPLNALSFDPSKKLWVESYVNKVYGKKASLILSIIERESDFNQNARNGSCIGLMQVNSKVWFSKDKKYNLIKLGILKSKRDLYNPVLNIKAGVYILRFYKWNYKKYRGLK